MCNTLVCASQHGHSHFSPAEPPPDNVLHNGDALARNDSIVLTNISSVTADGSKPEPPPLAPAPAQVLTGGSRLSLAAHVLIWESRIWRLARKEVCAS